MEVSDLSACFQVTKKNCGLRITLIVFNLSWWNTKNEKLKEVLMTNFNLILFEPYIESERRSISLFKMGCQSKHLFSYDSNLIFRKIFIKVKQQWVNFSFCSLRQQGVILDKIEWLSSEFHIGDLIFWESQVAQISLFLFQICVPRFWRDPWTKALSGCRLNFVLPGTLRMRISMTVGLEMPFEQNTSKDLKKNNAFASEAKQR